MNEVAIDGYKHVNISSTITTSSVVTQMILQPEIHRPKLVKYCSMNTSKQINYEHEKNENQLVSQYVNLELNEQIVETLILYKCYKSINSIKYKHFKIDTF